MKMFVWAAIIFVIIGIFLIQSALRTDFSSPGEVKTFVGAVYAWFFQVGKSTYTVGKTAAEQPWLPEVDEYSNTTYIVKE